MYSSQRKFKGHECDLVFRNIDEYTHTTGELTICQRALAALLGTFLLSRRHPATKKFFPSSAAIKKERLRQMRTYYYIIHPCSEFRIQWETFMVVIFILSLIINPYDVSFNSNKTTNKLDNPLYIPIFTMDVCCTVNVCINFLTGCYRSQSKIVHLEPLVIAKHYICGRFIIDFISSIQFNGLVHLLFNIRYMAHGSLYLLKFLRIFCLIFYLKHVTKRFSIKYVTAKVIKSCIVLAVFVHWTACMSYFTVNLVQGNQFQLHDKRSWVIKSEIYKKQHYEKYWACVFRAVSNMFSCSHGVHPPITIEDMLWTIFMSLSGAVMLIFTLVQVMLILKTRNVSRTKREEMSVMLSEFMHHKQFPEELQRKLRQYYEFTFHKGYFDEDMIVDFISGQLRKELHLHTCRRLVENVTFFENIPNELMLNIVSCLRPEILLVNDVVVKAGARGDTMFFLASGCVAVYTASGEEVTHLVDGAHFGEVVLVMEDYTRIASVVVVETSEVYSLRRDDFRTAVAPYPQLLKLIEESAHKRRESTLIMEEQSRRKMREVKGDNGVSGTRK